MGSSSADETRRDTHDRSRSHDRVLPVRHDPGVVRRQRDYRWHQRDDGTNALVDRNGDEFPLDWWLYGISADRAALDAYLRYHYEQGLSSRLWKIEDVFAAGLLNT